MDGVVIPDDRLRSDDLQAAIRNAGDFVLAATGNVAIVAGPPGLGKTHHVLNEIGAWKTGTILAPSHRLLDEREAEAKALSVGEVDRKRGLLSVLNEKGEPVCRHADKLRPFAEQRYRLRELVCDVCPDKRNYKRTGQPCPANAYDPGSGPTFASHSHAPVLGPEGDLPLTLYVDELPALVRTVQVSVDELLTVIKPHADSDLNAWCASRQAFVAILLKAATRLLEDDGRADVDAYAKRVVSDLLRDHLVGAAGGEETLETAIGALLSAHQREGTPPPPDGKDILAGKVTPESRPRLDLDDVLIALAREGVATCDGRAACIAVGPLPRSLAGEDEKETNADSDVDVSNASRRGVWIEYRSRAFDEWNGEEGEPLPGVILDATAPLMLGAIQAALPRCHVRVFKVDAPELEGAVTRVHIPTRSLTRRALFGRSGQRRRLARDADAALAGVLLRVVALARGEEAGIITYKPLAILLRASLSARDDDERVAFAEERNCTRTLVALDELRRRADLNVERIIWFWGERGSNALASCGLIAVLGDPWPNIGAAYEEARMLGIGGERYARSLLDAEVAQALGRGREVRRTPDKPLTLIYAGRERPVCWARVVTVELPHRGGGPTPSLPSMLAEEIARSMIECWGIASPALAKLCADAPEVAKALDSARQLLIKNEDNRSYRGIRLEDLEEIIKLPSKTLEDAFRRAVGHLDAPYRANPTGRSGRWKLYARSPEAAEQAVAIIIRTLAARRGR